MSLSPNLNSTSAAKHSDAKRDAVLKGANKGTRDVVELFVELAQIAGLPKSFAEIYGMLYASPRALSFKEIQESAGLSKGSVSQGLRFLRTVGAVKQAEHPNARCEYFEPEVELKQLVGGFLKERVNPQIKLWGKKVKQLDVSHFGDEISEDERDCMEGRIKKLRRWQKQAGLALPMLGRLLGG